MAAAMSMMLLLWPTMFCCQPEPLYVLIAGKMIRAAFVALALACTSFTFQATAQSAEQTPYKNLQLPIEQRVKDLVSRMTLKEKVSQLGHTADAIPRLDVPQYDWWNEGLHGVARAGTATVFPQAIGMAATFDEPLMHEIASVISTEFRAKYAETMHPDGSTDWYRGLTVWSPNINIFRDPRWGRGQETYGEDPYLTSRIGLAFVTGLQGNNPKYLKTVATAKHFAVHSGPELTRHSVDVVASKHDMEDTYLPAFRTLVMEGKAGSVMCAYNSLNGQPACANEDLLKKHLREDWGFKGYVVSDCGAITDVSAGHHYVKTMAEGAAVSFKAGTDLICGVPPEERVKAEKEALEKAVATGLISEAVLDRSLERLFSARFHLGMFDPSGMVPWSNITPNENDSEQHRQLSVKAARESLVLLKNNNKLLPLKKSYKTIAVIGPNADDLDVLVGNYNGTPSKPVTLLAGIKKRFATSTVIYARGTELTAPGNSQQPAAQNGLAALAAQEAIEAVQKSDLVIVALGLSPKIEGEEMPVDADGFQGGDRTKIDLPAPQQQLLERIHREGKPVILVLMGGSAIAVNWADRNIPAIIEAWYPGAEGGTAIAEVLAGDFSPAGRLPVTFYKSLSQLPPFEDYSMTNRTYRYFPEEVLYPFGHGLSYTTFSYADAQVDKKSVPADGHVNITVKIANTGPVAGDEVVQLYLTHSGVAGAPLRSLQGFQRVHLKPREKRTITFTLSNRQLSLVNEQGERRILPGPVQVWVGGGQPVGRAGLPKPNGVTTSFAVVGERKLPD
jgi:beta-glucosidase